MTTAALDAPPVPERLRALSPWLYRAAAFVAYASAFAQAATLAICAYVGKGGGMVTVLHRATPTYDVAAWHYPMRGGWGLGLTLLQTVIILAAMVMTASRETFKRRTGLMLMAGWGAFWAWRIAHVAWFTRDATDFTLAAVALFALACQGALCVGRWPAQSRAVPA